MYRFLIIEDDQTSAERLRGFVERYLAERGTDASIEHVPSAFEFVESKARYDLVFMDINLPVINGMEAARMLRERDSETLLVFVTDLARYAVRGYEVDALDFVVKPVNYEAIRMRMDRVMRALEARPSTSVSISTRGGMRVFPVGDLVYVEVRGHDLIYHLRNGRVERVRGTMKSFVETAKHPQLIQISSGYVANADHVRSIDGQEVTMSNGDVIVISRPRRKAAMEAFAKYYGGVR